jgi:glycosyltransferase involved in cell wall biosynthesis
LIILDDASQDASVERIRRWLSQQAATHRFVAHASNAGVCRTFNEGLALSRGQYVCIVATDDLWLPHKLEAQVALMAGESAGVGVSYSDAHIIDECGRRTGQSFLEVHTSSRDCPEGDVYDRLLRDNFVPAMTTMVRRECFEVVGMYDEALSFEDWDMWLRLAQRYRFVCLPSPTAYYRIVMGSLVRGLGVRWHIDAIRILGKHLGSSPEADRRIRMRMAASAQTIWVRGHPRGRHYMWLRLRYERTLKSLCWYVIALVGVRYSHVARVKRGVMRARRAVKSSNDA